MFCYKIGKLTHYKNTHVLKYVDLIIIDFLNYFIMFTLYEFKITLNISYKFKLMCYIFSLYKCLQKHVIIIYI